MIKLPLEQPDEPAVKGEPASALDMNESDVGAPEPGVNV